MKTKFINSVSYIIVLSLVGVFFLTSCEKEPEAMDLPPAESLIIDMDAFPTSTTKSVEAGIGNWFYSTGTIIVWNIGIALNMAIPVAAYTEAFNHTPVYLGDNSWEWKYSVPVNMVTYVASLVGTRIDNETFSMEMYLSQEGGFQDFLWFEGVIRYDHTEANWTLNYSPATATEFLEISFNRDFESDIYTTRYDVVDPANDLYQGYIEYGYNDTLDLNAHYTIHRADTTTFIEWSIPYHNGRVKDQRFFGDDAWHCWDTQLLDVDCPTE